MDREKFLRILPWISTPLLLLVIFGVWKLYTTVSDISEFVIPTPEAAWASLVDLMLEPRQHFPKQPPTVFVFQRRCD